MLFYHDIEMGIYSRWVQEYAVYFFYPNKALITIEDVRLSMFMYSPSDVLIM